MTSPADPANADRQGPSRPGGEDVPERAPAGAPEPRPGESTRWYEDGLRFSCTACGNCCKSHGEYSHVYLREEEVHAVVEYLDADPVQFAADHLEIEDGWITLRQGADQCVFLNAEGGCSIYPVRPVQCRTWPFWDINLERSVWETKVQPVCPGSRTGHLHDANTVDMIATATEDWYADRLDRWTGPEPGSPSQVAEAAPEGVPDDGADSPR